MKLTDEELKMTNAIGACRFLPGSAEKRFAHAMDGFTGEVTERQRWYVYYYCYRFRRQMIGAERELVTVAEKFLDANPEAPPKKARPKKEKAKSEPPPKRLTFNYLYFKANEFFRHTSKTKIRR